METLPRAREGFEPGSYFTASTALCFITDSQIQILAGL